MAAVHLAAGLLLLCAAGATASIVGKGECPELDVVSDFDAARYEGLWYEASRTLPLLELGGTCPKVQYSLDTNTGDYAAVYTIQRGSKEHRVSAKAWPVDHSKKVGDYVATVDIFSLYFLSTVNVSAPYKIVGTDYDNFAVVVSCISVHDRVHGSAIVVLTRQRQVTDEVQKKIDDVIAKAGVSDIRLLRTAQDDCQD